MENASKALLMSAEVLVGVLIIIVMVYLFVTMQGWAKEVQENIDVKSVYEFNSKFTVYEEREDLTAQDVVSIINLAKSINKKYEGTDFQMSVQRSGQFPDLTIGNNLLSIDTDEFLLKCSLNTATNKQHRYSLKITGYNFELVSNISITCNSL